MMLSTTSRQKQIPSSIQKLLGIDPDATFDITDVAGNVLESKRIGDNCPGIALPRNKRILDKMNDGKDPEIHLKAVHKGKVDGGISGVLASQIPVNSVVDTLSERQQVIETLRIALLTTPGHENQWPVARAWLLKMQGHNKLASGLVIPGL
jgi:hypothetical protein